MADETEVSVFDNGPLKVTGKIALKDGKGQKFDLSGRESVALCRCGASANKPFCDGSHKGAGFDSAVKAG